MIIGGVVVVALVVVGVTAPIWLRPIVEARASAAINRKVTIGKLAIHLSPFQVVATDIVVAGTTQSQPFAAVAQIAATLDLRPALHLRTPNIPDVSIDRLNVEAIQNSDGSNNYTFQLPPASPKPSPGPEIGVVHISDSHAHLLMAKQDADINLTLHTDNAASDDNNDGAIIGDVSGTYKKQKVDGHLKAGALLNLRDPSHPYPIDAMIENGDTRFTAAGAAVDPFHMHGASIKVTLKGQNLADLYAITGVPIPPTPPYDFSSAIDYQSGIIRLANLVGRLGSSDVQGELDVDTSKPRNVLSGELLSHKVDLEDLAGFIGSQPGRSDTPNQTAAQKQAVAKAEASRQLIPNVRIDISKIRSTDFHIGFRSEAIVGKSVPFDSLAARINIVDGHIKVTDLKAGVGKGQILAQIDMAPIQQGKEDTIHTVADFKFQQLDVGRMLSSTGFIRGAGTLGGAMNLNANGRSLSEMLSQGDGHAALFMAGGNVSSLIIDLSGLHLGDASLSALGIPNRDPVQCLIGDLALTKGILKAQTVLLETDSDQTSLTGDIDLRNETIDARLRTQPKHFTIVTFNTPIDISGKLKSPSIRPEAGELGARGAGAVGLGLLFPPAALLATIQFGIGDNNACASLVKAGEAKR